MWCNLHKCYENENSLIHCIESVALVNITLIQMIQDFLFAYVMMIIHRLSDVSSCSEAMNQLRLEPKLKSLSQSTATGSNDCGHTKMQWIILVVSPIKLNFPKRYHYSTFLGNGKTLCQIISNFIVTRNCDDKFFTMFNTRKWCWTHAYFSFSVYFSETLSRFFMVFLLVIKSGVHTGKISKSFNISTKLILAFP